MIYSALQSDIILCDSKGSISSYFKNILNINLYSALQSCEQYLSSFKICIIIGFNRSVDDPSKDGIEHLIKSLALNFLSVMYFKGFYWCIVKAGIKNKSIKSFAKFFNTDILEGYFKYIISTALGHGFAVLYHEDNPMDLNGYDYQDFDVH
mgnify:CR=1 FL=1